jgi:hypothetical protein
MKTTYKTFNSLSLSLARKEAKELGIKLPKYMHTLRTTYGPNVYYQVESQTGTIWEGNADDANDAKAKAINGLIEKHQTQ